jgi:uncharacterized protein YndB with AHSA1/START domain
MPDTTIAVQRTLTVAAPPERAFTVFTERLGTWWPLQPYSIGEEPAVDAVVEPREGGRWYERAASGAECTWGHVRVWDPPGRVVLTWEISADWQPDPASTSEVDVRFTAEGDGRTRVDLEHRGLETYAERAEEMRAIFGSDNGWNGLLRPFAAAAEAA